MKVHESRVQMLLLHGLCRQMLWSRVTCLALVQERPLSASPKKVQQRKFDMALNQLRQLMQLMQLMQLVTRGGTLNHLESSFHMRLVVTSTVSVAGGCEGPTLW